MRCVHGHRRPGGALVPDAGGPGAIVEVEVETGIVKVERYVAVEDCGALMNPAVVEGQIRGGGDRGRCVPAW